MTASIPYVRSTNSVSRIKNLLNDIPTVVDDALKGMVMANRGLVLLEGHRIIMRRDQAEMKGKVKLLTGGGAGHEPFPFGFVGPGMFTAAVLGNVFYSPPTLVILQALRELGRDHPEGILIIIPNYTGTRFNFGTAMERARNEGINVKILMVGEDCAFTDKVKREEQRGLAGILFISKLAGAMSEEGKKLEDIFLTCRSASMSDLATIGVGVKLSMLNPGISRFNLILKETELELGLGIRNEPGLRRIPNGTVAEIVYAMLEHVINPFCEPHIKFSPSCSIAVLINNLGGSSKLEENIFVMEVLKQLDGRGFKVDRVYYGCFLSSLESVGFSVTLLKISTPNMLNYLDAPTSAPAWPRTCASSVKMDSSENLPISVPSACPKDEKELRALKLQVGPKMSEKSALNVSQVIRFATDALASCELQLNQFDTEASNGDTGSVLKAGAMAIKKALQTGTIMVNRPFAMLEDMSSVIEASVGGTSAGLYGVLLSAAAKPFAKGNETDPVDAYLWLEALRSGTQAVMRYGRANVGDRTMVDALHSAIIGLERGLRDNPSDHIAALRLAAEAAQEAAEKTIGMEAHCGKQSESGNMIPFVMPDPGAAAVGIWMRALYEGCRLLF